jgi:hypothetical protein
MTERSEGSLEEAWRQAGRFLHQFARVESALNNVVKRVLDLEDKKGDYLVKQFDIARKIDLAKFAIKAEEERHFPAWVEKANSTIHALHKVNNIRVVFAHQPFEPDGKGGVVFNTETARNKGLPETLTNQQLEESHTRMAELQKDLGLLYSDLRPIINFDELPPLSFPPPSLVPMGILGSWDDLDFRPGRYREGED